MPPLRSGATVTSVSFLALICKNLIRQPVRSALTVLGIGIGITTVVALGVITAGAKETAGEYLRVGGADFIVAQKGAADMSLSSLSTEDVARVASEPGVSGASGVLMHFTRVDDNPFFGVYGVDPAKIADRPLVAGRRIRAPDEAVVGHRAAEKQDLAVGSTLVLADERFRVVGIFRTGNTPEDAGAYLPLETVQRLAAKPGVVTVIYVTVEPGADPAVVAASIERDHKQLAAVATLADYSEIDQGMQAMDAGNLAISLLAVGIGAIGVMNTMVMSVFERTREFGILRAVGWRGRRILRMILLESLLLCLAAAVLGLGLGWLAVQGVMLVPAISSFLEPVVTVAIVVRALAVAVTVALAGALYPAVRAVRLSPMEALRHE